MLLMVVSCSAVEGCFGLLGLDNLRNLTRFQCWAAFLRWILEKIWIFYNKQILRDWKIRELVKIEEALKRKFRRFEEVKKLRENQKNRESLKSVIFILDWFESGINITDSFLRFLPWVFFVEKRHFWEKTLFLRENWYFWNEIVIFESLVTKFSIRELRYRRISLYVGGEV